VRDTRAYSFGLHACRRPTSEPASGAAHGAGAHCFKLGATRRGRARRCRAVVFKATRYNHDEAQQLLAGQGLRPIRIAMDHRQGYVFLSLCIGQSPREGTAAAPIKNHITRRERSRVYTLLPTIPSTLIFFPFFHRSRVCSAHITPRGCVHLNHSRGAACQGASSDTALGALGRRLSGSMSIPHAALASVGGPYR